MKALILRAPHELAIQEQSLGPLPEGWARVRMLAAALNHRDEWIIQGQYAKIRYPSILGSDGCGIVVDVTGEDRSLIGKRVIINPNQEWGSDERAQSSAYTILGMPSAGTFAEYVDVPVHRLHRTPEHLSDEEAAALPLAGLTAYRAVFVQGGFTPDDTLLITGIGGGVALFALQFAFAAGAASVAVTSGASWKLDRAKELGAHCGVLYTTDDWWEEIRRAFGGFDLAVDGTCGEQFNRLVAIAKPAGRIVIYGATAGPVPMLDVHRIFWKQLRIIGSTMGSDDNFSQMVDFVARHRIKPIVDSVYALEEYEHAFARLRQRQQFGKVILRIAER